MDNKAFCLSRRSDYTCEKIFENDGVTFSYGIVQPYNSYVMGSGKTEEEAWEKAATNILIKEDEHRQLTKGI